MVLYKFYKNDCPSCYAISRLLMRAEIPSDVEIIQKNVELSENKDFAKNNNINKVPVLMFENGNKLEGHIPMSQLLEFLNTKGVKNAISN